MATLVEEPVIRTLLLSALALTTVAAAPQHRAPAPASAHGPVGRETTIPLILPQRIRDFEPDGDRALYVQDMRFRWYHVELDGRCPSLPSVTAIAVRSRYSLTLDRADDVIVDGRPCTIARIATSAAPVRGHRGRGRS